MDREREAAIQFENAIAIEPTPETFYRLGGMWQKQGRLDDAIAAYQQALALDAAHAGALEALCRLFQELGREDESIPFLDRATAVRAGAEWLDRYATAWERFDLGQVDEALALFRQSAGGDGAAPLETAAAVIIPGSPRSDNQAILDARVAWAEQYLPRPKPRRGRRREPDGDRLRIGYVSSFFHCDNWMKPVWGLINHHDRRRFEIHLFSEGPPAAIQHGYERHPQDRFHEIRGISVEAAADCIEKAGIDVLVDLNGYSRVETLPLFALRPAPVAVGWFNMYATTGMSCYDCLIGDSVVIPEEEEKFYCEKIERVPGSYLTFEVGYPTPPVAPSPCLTSRRFTFGCLASAYKITPAVVEAWSRVLRQAPESSLLLRNSALAAHGVRQEIHRMFEACRIAPERLRLEGAADHFEFLGTYGDIDVALDTFPYSGGTTTTEALWQGVPVLTFCGDRWASRTSASILRAAHLDRFVAPSLDDHVAMAVGLADSPQRWIDLAEMRRTMRPRLLASPVCDTRSFARNMEVIYSKYAVKASIEDPSFPTLL